MALLTAGDQGVELIRPDGNIVTMTADEVYYQLRAIKSMIDDNCKSRPVIFQVGDLYHAGALSVGGPGLNAPQARVCQDTAVYNNKLLKKALAPWPKDKTVFTEEEIACFTFLALTRTVQTQATAFEVREETRAAIEELRAQLQAARAQLNARAQQPHATSIANERRPKPAGHKLLVVEGWIPILEDQGPEVLKAAVLAAVAPGGFRDHARHSWEAVAGIVDACAAVAVMGGIPLDLLEAAQRALDDFVIAAGTFTVAQYLQVRRQWAAKAEGPAGLVAAFRHYGTGNVICHNCGESGHFAISCRLPCRVSAQTALCNSLPSQSGLLGTQVGGPRATLTPELIEGAAFSQKNEEAPVDIPLAVSMNRRMATMGGSVYGAQAPIASGSTSSHAGENRDWPREVWPHAPNPNRNVSRSRVWPTDQRLSSHAGANRGRYEASNDSRSDGHAGENRGEFQRSEMNPTVRDGLRKRRVRHRQRTAIRKARFSPGATMNQRVHSDSSVLGIGDSNTEDVDRRAVSTRQFTDDSAQRDGGNAVLAKPLQEEFLRSGESSPVFHAEGLPHPRAKADGVLGHLPLRPHLELGANPTLGPSPDAQVADGSDLESVDDRSHGAESMKATTPPVASGDGVPRRAHRNRFAVVGRAQSDASDPSVRPEGSECGCLRTHEGQRIGDAAGSLGLPEQPPQAAMVAAEESSELRRVQHQLGGQDAEAVSGSEKQPALVNRDLQGSVVTHNPPDVPHVSVAYGGEGPEGSGSHPVNHCEARTVNATFSIQDDHLRGSNGPNRKRAIIDEFVIPAWPRSATRGRDKYWNLPPHVKKVDVLHISALRALALQDEGHAEALERALRWITNSDAYSALTIKTEPPRDADVPFTDVRRLLEDGIVELTTKEDALQWGRVFSVPETHKNRRRIIYWPKTVNEAIQTAQAAANEKAFPFTLGLPEEHLAEVFDGDVAASIDLVCAFYQNELVPDVRRYFAFRARDEEGHVAWYRFKRLPMGLVPACEVQQAVTQVLAKTTADVASRVYIDGIRHVGTREEVERALSETKAKCDAVHAQFTEVPISTTHKWLGVMYDFEAKKVRLSDSFIEKLALAFANLESATVADTAQLYGHLFYGSRVLQVPLAQFYHGVKFYAKCSRRWQRDESAGSQPANIWPSIIPLLREWIATLLENEPVTPLKRSEPSDEVIIFADASADGWGSVTFCDGEVICSKGTFEKAKGLHINVKEVLAVSNALRESSLDMSGRRVRIVIDNVSAKAAIRDGYARSFNINVAVKEVQKSMVQRGITDFRISYIKSALNPADKPSRGEMYDNSQLLNALSSLQQLPSEWGMGLRTFYRAMAVCRGQGRLPVPPHRQRPTHHG